MKRLLILLLILNSSSLTFDMPEVGGAGREVDSEIDSDTDSSEDYANLDATQYSNIMLEIQLINKKTYNNLKLCEKEENMFCIVFSKNIKGKIDFNDDALGEYPFIFLPSTFMTFSETKRIKVLTELSNQYNYYFKLVDNELTISEHSEVLEIIEKIAPNLYKIISDTDEDGINHIVRNPTNEEKLAYP